MFFIMKTQPAQNISSLPSPTVYERFKEVVGKTALVVAGIFASYLLAQKLNPTSPFFVTLSIFGSAFAIYLAFKPSPPESNFEQLLQKVIEPLTSRLTTIEELLRKHGATPLPEPPGSHVQSTELMPPPPAPPPTMSLTSKSMPPPAPPLSSFDEEKTSTASVGSAKPPSAARSSSRGAAASVSSQASGSAGPSNDEIVARAQQMSFPTETPLKQRARQRKEQQNQINQGKNPDPTGNAYVDAHNQIQSKRAAIVGTKEPETPAPSTQGLTSKRNLTGVLEAASASQPANKDEIDALARKMSALQNQGDADPKAPQQQ